MTIGDLARVVLKDVGWGEGGVGGKLRAVLFSCTPVSWQQSSIIIDIKMDTGHWIGSWQIRVWVGGLMDKQTAGTFLLHVYVALADVF